MQAAILRVKLQHLEQDNTRRNRFAERYADQLGGGHVIVPSIRPTATHVFHLFVIRSDRRDELQAFLKDNGVGALVHYPVPVHLQPAYRGRLTGSDDLGTTERVAREVLSLPLYPEISDTDVQTVIDAVKRFTH
jgi:dTDP-4-amino-4,6-dideoxygalactose transaminase